MGNRSLTGENLWHFFTAITLGLVCLDQNDIQGHAVQTKEGVACLDHPSSGTLELGDKCGMSYPWHWAPRLLYRFFRVWLGKSNNLFQYTGQCSKMEERKLGV